MNNEYETRAFHGEPVPVNSRLLDSANDSDIGFDAEPLNITHELIKILWP